ncbi:MAG TPA: penicillin-binding protein 2 [Acidobacteriota bacterium]
MSTVGPWRPNSANGGSAPRRPRLRFRSQRPGGDAMLESPVTRSRLTTRVHLAEGFVILLVTILLFGFWRLQVVHATHYRELAENNRHRNLIVRAPRGLMFDRSDLLVAANRPAFNVAIVREELDDRPATLAWLASVLGETREELDARLERDRRIPVFQPVVIAEDIPRPLVAAIEARSLEFPGVLIQPEHMRYYPEGTLAAHVLGHVGEISREQLDAWGGDRYRMGDIIGKNGLESVHNDSLSGYAGQEQLLVNSSGRTVQVLDQTPPQPGRTLALTLDLPLQRRAEALLEGRRGAIVVLDVNTGGVLALASSPTFDPNMFARRFSTAEWDALRNDPARPLQNRALQSAFPPGSVFKLVMALAGLENGVITPQTTVYCPGGGTYFGQRRNCNAVHGTVNLKSAIGRSCNVYFYELGAKLGREKIVEVAERYGFGARTGIDLLEERGGTLPTDEWIARAPGREGNWYPGETIVLSIGQGPIDVTPLQMAHMVATLATGTEITPHLIESEQDAAGRAQPVELAVPSVDVRLNPLHQEAILEGMWAAVNESGTGWRARNPEIPYGGKTGSAQVAATAAAGPEALRPEELRNHAWFVGVAPVDDPQVSIAVFIEHGGAGGAIAAPIAGSVLNAWFEARRNAQ